jgi:hypothetical protein
MLDRDSIIIITSFVILYGITNGPIGLLYGLIVGLIIAFVKYNHY